MAGHTWMHRDTVSWGRDGGVSFELQKSGSLILSGTLIQILNLQKLGWTLLYIVWVFSLSAGMVRLGRNREVLGCSLPPGFFFKALDHNLQSEGVLFNWDLGQQKEDSSLCVKIWVWIPSQHETLQDGSLLPSCQLTEPMKKGKRKKNE